MSCLTGDAVAAELAIRGALNTMQAMADPPARVRYVGRFCRLQLSWIRAHEGRFDEALASLGEEAALALRDEDTEDWLTARHAIGCTLLMMGRESAAIDEFRQLSAAVIETDNPGQVVAFCQDFAAALCAAGDPMLAARLLGAAQGLQQDYGMTDSGEQDLQLRRTMDRLSAQLGAETLERMLGTGRTVPVELLLNEA